MELKQVSNNTGLIIVTLYVELTCIFPLDSTYFYIFVPFGHLVLQSVPYTPNDMYVNQGFLTGGEFPSRGEFGRFLREMFYQIG